MLLKLIGVALLGGMAELDRTSIFHGLLYEPIVLSPLAGYILGDPMLGLKIGIILQLFFLGSVSMGGSSPPDVAMAAIASVVSASLTGRYFYIPSEVTAPVVVLIVMFPAALAGRAVDIWRKENNVALLNNTEKELDNYGVKAVERAVWVGIGKNIIAYTSAVVIVAAAGTLVTAAALYVMPMGWWRGMKIIGDLILPASAGIALASIRGNRAILVYALVSAALWILIVIVR